MLDFPTPVGLRLGVSSLSSPNFATSYTLGSIGAVDGSLSYLYTALPLKVPSKIADIPLRHVIQGYRQLFELPRLDEAPWWESWHAGRKTEHHGTLLYGRLDLPVSRLEALYLRRLTPSIQLKVSGVSSSALKSGGSILFLLQRDVGKYSTEYLYSTDSALLGIRGLYNFGPDPRENTALPKLGNKATGDGRESHSSVGYNGRFSAGAEIYYGLLNKSGGLSTGIRFTTLPRHTGFPYTMTLTLNPLMGNLSSTYSVKAGPSLALCSRFDFNAYSYESELQVGCELWRRKRPKFNELDWVYSKLRSMDASISEEFGSSAVQNQVVAEDDQNNKLEEVDDDTVGVLKARINQDWGIALLWEGRAKELLYSCGLVIDLKRREQIFRGLGLEVQYSS